MAEKLGYYNQAKLDIDGDREIVRFVRDLPPAHYIIKIESFSKLLKKLIQIKGGKYECAEFSAGGYKWSLCIYPEGNKKENGEGHISLYLKMVDKLETSVVVAVSLKFFVYDQMRFKYLTILDIREKHFHAMKNEWGIPKLLPQGDFNDVSNGFLIDDSCVFGVEAFVVSKTTLEDGGTSLLSTVKESDILLDEEPKTETNTYTWKINNFSALKIEEYSPLFTIKGYEWKLILFPRGNVSQRDKSLSVFLQLHDLSKISGDKKLATKFYICLKNQLEGEDEKGDDGAVSFSKLTPRWGYTALLPLKELNDPSAGFKVNDSVIIQVTIEAIILVEK